MPGDDRIGLAGDDRFRNIVLLIVSCLSLPCFLGWVHEVMTAVWAMQARKNAKRGRKDVETRERNVRENANNDV